MDILQLVNSVISFIVGSSVVALINYKSASNRLKFKEGKFLAEIKEKENDKIEERDFKAKEFIIEKVIEINADNSLTMNYIMERNGTTELDIHNRYLMQSKTIREMIVKSRISQKGVLDDLNKLYGLSNLIWGNQQSYFGYSKENNESKDNLRKELLNYFDETSKCCTQILNSLW
jgi:hypothetical protein